MRDVLEMLDHWRAEGVGAGRAVVVRTFGSAPRPEGAVLVVANDGRMMGSVSGGCVEAAAAEEIDRARRTGNSRVIRYGISDEEAWDVGLACGGTIDILVQPAIPTEIMAAATGSLGARGQSVAVATPLPADAPPTEFGPHEPGAGAPPGATIAFDAHGTVLGGSTGDPGVDASVGAAAARILDDGRSRTIEVGGRAFFIEAFPVRPRLVIVGAVEVARSLVRYARELGYETVVVDGRATFATSERFPDADRIVVAWPDEAFDALDVGPNDVVAILSHDPKFDEPAIVEAMRRGCRYVGAVGSRKTQSDRRKRLLEAGLTADEISRLRGPIGLDLGGRDPAETGLAIMAEIVAARRGGSGVPLRERLAAGAAG
ncbi:MAG: XdhC family protein [Chloroflexi bacterium]|nr:XdhC family protein [Chloroflexota bacterium]